MSVLQSRQRGGVSPLAVREKLQTLCNTLDMIYAVALDQGVLDRCFRITRDDLCTTSPTLFTETEEVVDAMDRIVEAWEAVYKHSRCWRRPGW